MAILSGVTDQLNLRRLSEGDPSSASCFFKRYSRIAYSLALRITGDVRTAEAVVVEAFMELSRNAQDLDAKRGSVVLFLITETRRFALWRTRKRDRDVCDFLEMETADYPECVISLASRNTCSIISSTFAGLTEIQRRLLNLAFFDGLTCREIASRTGATEESVQKGIRSALMGISISFMACAE